MSDAQLAALAMGAHPYKVCSCTGTAPTASRSCAKLGIDVEKKWHEFETACAELKSGKKQFMTWEDADA
jgi:heterodisulfide reductase subunit B